MPLIGSYKPSISLPRVVLPEPTGPIMPTLSPAAISRVMLLRTFVVWPGYENVRFFTPITPLKRFLGKNVFPAGLSTGRFMISSSVFKASLA